MTKPDMADIDPTTLPYRHGVGIMLINAARHVFVAQRIDTDNDAWQMPQGGVDEGEEPDAAALRELEEETGIAAHRVTPITRSALPYDYDLPAELIGKLWGGKYRGQRQYWYLMRFDGDDAEIDIATEHPEFNAWRWAEAHTLPDLIVPFKRDLYTALVAEFTPHF
jgi:putative (di)nucleoside polyphosphate hydrolase